MIKTKNRHAVLFITGIVMLFGGLYLAIFHHFNHFYEIFIIGMFLVLKQALGRRISRRTYLTLYCIFVFAGLIGDLLMGLVITKLWRYNYSYLIEYATLYTIIYPFAGIVMVQSYIYFKNIILKVKGKKPGNPLLSIRNYHVIIAVLIAILVGNTYMLFSRFTPLRSILFYLFASLLAFFVLSLYSQIRGHKTLVEDLHKSPLKILATLFLATYINFLIQEVSNSYGHQWIYKNYPLSNASFLKVPVIPLLGWTLLLILPIAGYYYILPNARRHKKSKSR